MVAKILQFRRPSTVWSGLRMLYLEDGRAFFRYREGELELYFSLGPGGLQDVYVARPTGTYEILDNEELDKLHHVQKAAQTITDDQLRIWESCATIERLSLQITWIDDLLTDLRAALAQNVQHLSNPENETAALENVQLTLQDFVRLRGLRAGLLAAQKCL